MASTVRVFDDRHSMVAGDKRRAAANSVRDVGCIGNPSVRRAVGPGISGRDIARGIIEVRPWRSYSVRRREDKPREVGEINKRGVPGVGCIG